jgi:hypothetical protein
MWLACLAKVSFKYVAFPRSQLCIKDFYAADS